jgi:hypothetical protein
MKGKVMLWVPMVMRPRIAVLIGKDQQHSRVMRQYIIITSPSGLGTENDFAGETGSN